jgi:sugar phosphate isomerase/epimerase
MQALRDIEVGVFYWAEPDAAAAMATLKAMDVRVCQLGVTGELKLTPELAAAYRAAAAAEGIQIVTIFSAYEGEDYADIPTVVRTVGYIPHATRAAREVRSREVIGFAAAIGVKSFGCHAGFLPGDHGDPDYIGVREVVRRVADYAAGYGMTFCLETGQEPAPLLLRFFEDAARPNLRINFDPANMVLYGSGEPIEAFKLLRRHVATIHGKDGDWPDPARPGSLGVERPLGQGSVNIPKFIQTVRESGYQGSIHVESGVHGEEQPVVYLGRAVNYLRSLL